VARLRVATVLGTRPEVVKLACVLPALDAAVDHVVVHTGQNHAPALASGLFDELGLRPPDVQLSSARDTAAASIAEILRSVDEVLERVRPDAVLIYGDTNSGLCALVAKRRGIVVFHMEAGNRCFDDRTPEEVNRRVIDHTADVNMTISEHARRHLLAEGLRPDRVFRTGSPMREVLDRYAPRIAASDALSRLGLSPGSYLAASLHREENVDPEPRLLSLLAALEAAARATGLPVVVSTHPRTRRRLEALEASGAASGLSRLRLLPPFGFLDWVRLMSASACVLSDSGTLSEEAALLGFPAVMLRESHERPEGVETGASVMAGLDPDRIVDAVSLARRQATEGFRPAVPPDYGDPNVSAVVTRIVVGYTEFVRPRSTRPVPP
jgi:UDP-N-acetylglucosamine 2-epimerase